MKLTEIKSIIAQVIAEAMEEKKALKSKGTNLVEYKKELGDLKKMKESLSQYSMNEGIGEEMVVEFAYMQKYVNELKKIQEAYSRLSEMLDNKITEVEGKVSSETQKVKEMIGLAPKTEVKKEPKKSVKKEEDKKEDKEDKKKTLSEATYTIDNNGISRMIMNPAKAAIKNNQKVTVDNQPIKSVSAIRFQFTSEDGKLIDIVDVLKNNGKININGKVIDTKGLIATSSEKFTSNTSTSDISNKDFDPKDVYPQGSKKD